MNELLLNFFYLYPAHNYHVTTILEIDTIFQVEIRKISQEGHEVLWLYPRPCG